MDPNSLNSTLSALGVELPGPGYLVGLLVFGIAGLIFYRRGKKLDRPQLKWLGLAIMLYPYAISQTWLLWLIGAALSVWAYTRWE